MISRHKMLALLLSAVLFALAPLGVSAAATTRPAPVALAAAFQNGGVTVPVAGTTSKGGKFTGNFAISRFQVVVGSSRVDLQACKLEYSIVSPK